MLHGGHVMDGAKLAEDKSLRDRALMEMINMGPTGVELPQGLYLRAFQSILGAQADDEENKAARERAQSFGSIINKHAVSEELDAIDEDDEDDEEEEDEDDGLLARKKGGLGKKKEGKNSAKEAMLADEDEDEDDDDEDDDYAKNYYDSDAEEAAGDEEAAL